MTISIPLCSIDLIRGRLVAAKSLLEFGVKRRGPWKVLAKLDYKVAKQQCWDLLHRLGLLQCFDELCEVGQLSGIFTREIFPSEDLVVL
ncbi:hypothetical protein SASPL_137128 [Salvia splendens]|uniref:Uncharacterized protein n=1 Tax=Salvia splendens TaxID=180675 RepID=A0A8X8ZCN6_SALSN|nr:hypothetical protein SASPL_137128 [Salvia splendens]